MLHARLIVIALSLFSTSLLVADEPVFSGPQKGEVVPGFEVQGVFDDLAGKKLDFVKDAGGSPLVLLFMHQLTRPSGAVTRAVTGYSQSLKEKGVKTAVVWLAEDKSEAQRYLTQTRRALGLTMPVGVSLQGAEGPGELGLNRNVTLTILLVKGGKVEANYALVQPSVTEVPAIAAEIAKMAGVEPPTQEQIYALSGQNMERMQRPRAAGGDAKLRQLLRAMVAEGLDEAKVNEAAAAVESHVGQDEAKRGELARLAASLLDLGFGNESVQRRLNRWSGPTGAARPPEAARPDAQLGEMLRQLIQPGVTQERIDGVVKDVERYVGDDAAKRAELLRISRAVVERSYGTELGRKPFEAWIKKYGEQR